MIFLSIALCNRNRLTVQVFRQNVFRQDGWYSETFFYVIIYNHIYVWYGHTHLSKVIDRWLLNVNEVMSYKHTYHMLVSLQVIAYIPFYVFI